MGLSRRTANIDGVRLTADRNEFECVLVRGSINSRRFVGDYLLAGDIPVLLGDVAEQLSADDIIK